MVQRFYIDTSVIGGVFDEEFEEHSTILFERIKLGSVTAVISVITEKELSRAEEKVKAFFRSLPDECIEYADLTDEAIELADAYIREGVVGKSSRDDCLHIAIASISKVDILVSWNFKHIVNIYRIRGYNAVNLQHGHETLEIRSPKEIVGYENED